MSITPSPTPAPALAPVVLGCVAGCSVNFVRETPNDDGSFGGEYAGNEPITATIWVPGAASYAFQQVGPPGNRWIDATKSSWIVSLDDARTAAIGAGTFDMRVTAPLGTGRTGVLFEGQLVVEAGAPTS